MKNIPLVQSICVIVLATASVPDNYDRNISVPTDAARRARLGQSDKLDALRRVSELGRT
jgi:hypothetical protein